MLVNICTKLKIYTLFVSPQSGKYYLTIDKIGMKIFFTQDYTGQYKNKNIFLKNLASMCKIVLKIILLFIY